MNAGRKNTKAIHGIPAKVIHFHWLPKEAMVGNVRPEQAQSKSCSNKDKSFTELQINLHPVITILENSE
jgi:hypothetical protein